jgi:hypothetical protein
MVEGGNPSVTVTAGEVQFGHGSGDAAPDSVLLDVAAILKAVMGKASRSNYDARSGVVQVDTGRVVLNLSVPSNPADQTILGFDELAVGNDDFGFLVKVAKSAGPKLDYFSVTPGAVRNLGLPVRTPGKEFDARRLG